MLATLVEAVGTDGVVIVAGQNGTTITQLVVGLEHVAANGTRLPEVGACI